MEAVLNGPFGRVDLGSTPLTIGRTPTNQLILADSKVSTHHAEIRPQGHDYALIDLGSTNGTFLNEQRLDAHAPHLLHAADIVLIGDTRFTYEVPGMSNSEPTVYAGSRQLSELGYSSSVAAPFVPATDYGSYIQPAEYQPVAPYPAAPASGHASDVQLAAYQSPPPPPVGLEPSIYPPASPYYGAPVPALAQPRGRRGFWIILVAIVSALVLIGLVTFGVIAYANRSTPTKTLNAFCNALESGNYQTAYNQLSNGLQSKVGSEAQFAADYSSNAGFGKITNCTVSHVDDSVGTGTISNTFADGSTLVDNYILVDENGAWKINSQQPRSTPTLTLHTYCVAIKQGDYQTAYNQLSSAAQNQQSEAQFAANFSSGQTDCTVNQVSDAAGTGTVTYTYSSGNKLTADYTLVNENSTWKINSQQLHPTPTLTLLTYCSALKSGNYPVAYNQFSSSLQSQFTEAQFAAAFSTNNVTNCTVTNVNDTAGTGTISFTYANASTRVFDFVLINENGTWKIQKGQPRS